jgi:hypothetical protein
MELGQVPLAEPRAVVLALVRHGLATGLSGLLEVVMGLGERLGGWLGRDY